MSGDINPDWLAPPGPGQCLPGLRASGSPLLLDEGETLEHLLAMGLMHLPARYKAIAWPGKTETPKACRTSCGPKLPELPKPKTRRQEC